MLEQLIAKPQWILWRYETKEVGKKPTKVPYSTSGYGADVTNSRHFAPYVIAYNTFMNGGYDGMGFVLTSSDNLTFIDIDDTSDIEDDLLRAQTIHYQQQIVEAFDTYSEHSPSGKGLHIILNGKVNANRVRQGVEIYTAGHYMTMTFKPFQNKPIAERQQLLTQLWEQCVSKPDKIIQPIRESEAIYTDLEIYEMCCKGKNGDRFIELWQGHYDKHLGNDGNPDHSRADFALINIIGFYSRNIEQIKRMFLQSGLGYRIVSGQKKKAKNYIDNMARRSFDLQTPLVNTDALIAAIALESETKKTEAAKRSAITLEVSAKPTQEGWDLPPGLMGTMAKYIFDQAPHPFQEIALAGAMAFMAGICGRAYNISKTGLNQYIVVLADTGTGKEAAAMGIDNLIKELATVGKPWSVPVAADFSGPANISSGPALVKQLAETPCFMSLMTEFGLKMQRWCGKYASSSDISFRETLLGLYVKSGDSQSLRPTVYSERVKNTTVIKSPNFTILGESVPDEFYKTIDEASVAGGFLPRFTLLEYNGPRVHYNEAHEHVKPTDDVYGDMLQKLADLCVYSLNIQRMGNVNNVKVTPEALELLKDFRTHCTNQCNGCEMKVEKELWTRAYLKMIKLAALVAPGVNIYNPTVDVQMVLWAKRIVLADIRMIMRRFESGQVGMEQSEVNQREHVVKVVADILRRQVDETMIAYGMTQQYKDDLVFPQSYISRRLLPNNIFKGDRVGGTVAIERALKNLLVEGCIVEIRSNDVATRYGKTAKMYQIVEPSRFKR